MTINKTQQKIYEALAQQSIQCAVIYYRTIINMTSEGKWFYLNNYQMYKLCPTL